MLAFLMKERASRNVMWKTVTRNGERSASAYSKLSKREGIRTRAEEFAKVLGLELKYVLLPASAQMDWSELIQYLLDDRSARGITWPVINKITGRPGTGARFHGLAKTRSGVHEVAEEFAQVMGYVLEYAIVCDDGQDEPEEQNEDH